ncbi:MAG: efflux RND transporter periplasmic adaptor subunit [Bacteroidetes bacterium]|jgi:Cu(I)/Ag(I) efflux system membrane fusion protein|nr:efflux RND transporter periplasmic adaptor subunit [Bacteroidota bacterium]
MNTKRNILIIALAALAAGLLLGGLFFGGSGDQSKHDHQHDASAEEATTWTCSMHPQIRQNESGDCPICGMDLIPLEDEGEEQMDPEAIRMSETAMQLADVSTAKVEHRKPVKQVRLNGKVQTDERLVHSQSSHIPGRIEKLAVNFRGDYVQKGQTLAYIYSPRLVTAQEELFEARKIRETQPKMFRAAKDKMKNWKLTEKQIEQILQNGKVQERFPILADVSGYVMEKNVNMGDYIKQGETLFTLADISRVWILFDVYESDMPWMHKGDRVSFTVSSLPGEEFTGTISYIDPVINPRTRVAKARLEMKNTGSRLKPEMFVSGTVQATLTNRPETVVVPKSAVMWTGRRSVVYIKKETENSVSFRMREVTLGPALGDSYIIEQGLEEDEEIAVHGTFSIDAAAQLAGKPSMMNPTANGEKPNTGHDHGRVVKSTEDMKDHADHEPVKKDFEVPSEFKKQLEHVYDVYIGMKDAFVASDAQAVANQGRAVEKALAGVDMKLLEGEAHMEWMDYLETLKNNLETIVSSEDIDKQREAFAPFNLAFYKSLKQFGLPEGTVYYQYCPMAVGDDGAYWFSSQEEIRNPYFGDAMLKCGEVSETIDY